MSSTLLTEDTGVPFDQLQAEQIGMFLRAWADAGHQHEPPVSVSRSVLPIVDEEDRRFFGLSALREKRDQIGVVDGLVARFGRGYVGEPDAIAEELAADAAVRDADTLLLTVPNQFGVAFCTTMLETIVKYIAPTLGWKPNVEAP